MPQPHQLDARSADPSSLALIPWLCVVSSCQMEALLVEKTDEDLEVWVAEVVFTATSRNVVGFGDSLGEALSGLDLTTEQVRAAPRGRGKWGPEREVAGWQGPVELEAACEWSWAEAGREGEWVREFCVGHGCGCLCGAKGVEGAAHQIDASSQGQQHAWMDGETGAHTDGLLSCLDGPAGPHSGHSGSEWLTGRMAGGGDGSVHVYRERIHLHGRELLPPHTGPKTPSTHTRRPFLQISLLVTRRRSRSPLNYIIHSPDPLATPPTHSPPACLAPRWPR